MKLITAEQFEKLKPEEVTGKCVSKADFFALTWLKTMTDPGAAEATFQRWLQTGRVRQIVTTVEDPTGVNEDTTEITIEARFVNSERRRENIGKRKIEEARKMYMKELPAALQQA